MGLQTILKLASLQLGDALHVGTQGEGETIKLALRSPAWCLWAERIVWRGKGGHEGAEEGYWSQRGTG